MIKVEIGDSQGNGRGAHVTPRGELVVAPLEYSVFHSVKLDIANTGYNIVPPIAGFHFIITAAVIYASKTVGAGDATFDLYEATSSTSTTIVTSVFQQEIPSKTTVQISGVQVIVSEGAYLNAKTDDDDVFVNISGFYVKSFSSNGES